MSENYEHRAFFENQHKKEKPMHLSQKESDRVVWWTLIVALVCALIVTICLIQIHSQKNKPIDLTYDECVKNSLLISETE